MAEQQASDENSQEQQDDKQSSPDQESQRTDSQPSQPDTPDSEAEEGDQETFSKEYVTKLRKEAGDYRVKAKDRDDLAKRLHTELVRATGRLADPSDLPFDEAHLTDTDKLKEALDSLLEKKPHLASRRPRGDVGQGVGNGSGGSVNLAELLRANV